VDGPAGDSEQAEHGAHPRDRLKRDLRASDATFLVVSGVIGSGIFLTPGGIAELLPHPGLMLTAWLVGGGLSLAGALANAELAAMFPRAGGDYVYLREAFHPLAGFLVGWLSFFVIYTGTIATLAAGFAAALGYFVPMTSATEIAVAVGVTLAVSALNFVGVRFGAAANNVTAVVKVLALAAFALIGVLIGDGEIANLRPLVTGATQLTLSAFALAMSPVLFSYLGWNSSVYVASEVRDPARNVPRSLFFGVAICTVVYLLVNAVYLYAIPVDLLRNEANAGEGAARALFGGAGGTAVAIFVLISILGTLNATVLVGPRIAYAMALDGLFLRGVDRAHVRFHTPANAIVLQALVSVGILLFFENFSRTLDYTVFAILDVAALYALRRTQPGKQRPYRAWGYPWIPALYFFANAGVAGALLLENPVDCAIGLAIVVAGVPFYRLFSRRPKPGSDE